MRAFPWRLLPLHLLFSSSSFFLTVHSIPPGETHTAHLSPNPRNTLLDNLDLCSNYAVCASNGHRYWTTLLDTISQTPPNADRDDAAAFQEWYETDTVPLGSYGKGVRQDLVNHGVQWENMVLYATTSKDAATGDFSFDSAYGNIVDPIQGVIVAIENFRHLDDSAAQLPWSEIMYQTWRTVARPTTAASLSTFRYSIQNKVDNAQTQKILTLAYARMGYPAPAQGDATWRGWTAEHEGTRNWFWALLGTDNCKGTVWLLKDHAVEARGKVVREIWTRWPGVYPDIWMNIG
ncbi:MAG: hypothetical protein LQ349_001529 [Xanthoria aureola]|nr:MAG: hypothetical protein LQ349_001529 [Xanthoria aureola]